MHQRKVALGAAEASRSSRAQGAAQHMPASTACQLQRVAANGFAALLARDTAEGTPPDDARLQRLLGLCAAALRVRAALLEGGSVRALDDGWAANGSVIGERCHSDTTLFCCGSLLFSFLGGNVHNCVHSRTSMVLHMLRSSAMWGRGRISGAEEVWGRPGGAAGRRERHRAGHAGGAGGHGGRRRGGHRCEGPLQARWKSKPVENMQQHWQVFLEFDQRCLT